MDPFDVPPATPPVSVDPPLPDAGPPRRRGRTALVALAAAGLVGGGMVGISQFVSADRPEVGSGAPSLAAIEAPGDEGDVADDGTTDDGTTDDGTTDDGSDGAPEDGTEDGSGTDGDRPVIGGEIVIDTGDGDPIVIDLGDGFERLEECGLPVPGGGPWLDLHEGELPFEELDVLLDELPLGDVGMFAIDGTHVTVAGPDGVSVVELGDGDGSVTISQQDGEVTITTDGDATVRELPGVLELGPLGEDVDPEALEEMFGEEFDPEAMLEEMFGEDFDPEAMLDELFGEDFDPEADLDELFGRFEEGGQFELPADLEACLEDALAD
jgi:hypothetical protein